jgi:hypothetical protein
MMQCASSRAPWMALWMTNPARLTGYPDGSTARARQVHLHEIARRDLAEVQAERVDEVVARGARQAHGDVVEDLLDPAAAVEHAIAGGQSEPQAPFVRVAAVRPRALHILGLEHGVTPYAVIEVRRPL